MTQEIPLPSYHIALCTAGQDIVGSEDSLTWNLQLDELDKWDFFEKLLNYRTIKKSISAKFRTYSGIIFTLCLETLYQRIHSVRADQSLLWAAGATISNILLTSSPGPSGLVGPKIHDEATKDYRSLCRRGEGKREASLWNIEILGGLGCQGV